MVEECCPGISPERLALLPQSLRQLVSAEVPDDAAGDSSDAKGRTPQAEPTQQQPHSLASFWAAARSASDADQLARSGEPQPTGVQDRLLEAAPLSIADREPAADSPAGRLESEAVTRAGPQGAGDARSCPSQGGFAGRRAPGEDSPAGRQRLGSTAASLELEAAGRGQSAADPGQPRAGAGSEDTGVELRNPASPGCVYSGLRLELSPGANEQWPEEEDASSSPMQQECDMLDADAQQPQPGFAGLAVPAAPPGGLGNGLADNDLSGQSAAAAALQALPPASQVDASVLDALPLQMKREIERAYGEHLLQATKLDVIMISCHTVK